jgi:hypothetical protein
MFVIEAEDLERMVRRAFPQKRWFSAAAELGVRAERALFASVHGGCDPFLERQFEDWLVGRGAVRRALPAAQSPVPRGRPAAGRLRRQAASLTPRRRTSAASVRPCSG